MLGAVEMLHDQHRRILREGLVQHRAALLIGTDHLMRPPLMAGLVRRDEGDEIDLVAVGADGTIVLDEAERFGPRHGVGEGLREAGIVGKFQIAQLAELIGPECPGVDPERRLHRADHAVDLIGMMRVVIDCQVDAVPCVVLLGIRRRLQGEEIQDQRAGLEPRGTPAVPGHVEHLVARGDRRLVGDGGDGDVGAHPVRIMAQETIGARAVVLELGGAQLRRHEVIAAPLHRIGQKEVLVHAERRRDVAIVDEGAVIDDVGLVAAVLEALLLQHRAEHDPLRLTGRERLVEGVDHIVEIVVALLHMRARDRERLHLEPLRPAHMHLAERLALAVDDRIAAVCHDARLVRIDRHVEHHVGDLGRGQGVIFVERLLVIRRPAVVVDGRLIVVQDLDVVVDERAGAEPRHRRQRQQRAGLAAKPAR